jgi:uncharacterized protein YutE (UPF0331/DUF86 family)
MVNKIFIEEKINLIERDLSRLKIFADFTIAEISHDFIKYGALKSMMMEIIGRAIDINEHLIAELFEPKMDAPKSYKETFLILDNLKILPKDFAVKISKSAGFRNAIVHEYNNLDKGIVYKSVGEALEQYNQYCGCIMVFLEKNKKK